MIRQEEDFNSTKKLKTLFVGQRQYLLDDVHYLFLKSDHHFDIQNKVV